MSTSDKTIELQVSTCRIRAVRVVSTFVLRRAGSYVRQISNSNLAMLLSLGLPPLFGPSAFQNIFHRVVSLVTCVLENRLIDPGHWYRRRPWPRVRGWIIHRVPEIDGPVIHPPESLYDMQACSRRPAAVKRRKAHLVAIIRRIYHQRVALPVPHGIALPQPYLRRHMRPAVQINHPDLMQHLAHDHHRVSSLHDLHVVVVSARQLGFTACDAPLGQIQIRVGFIRSVFPTLFPPRRFSLLRRRSQGWNSAIRRIDNQRRQPAAVQPRQLSSCVPKNVVVAQPHSRLRSRTWPVPILLLCQLGLQGDRFLLTQKLPVRKPRRP